jgi:V/A-type H+-transporting ATPase subunit F
MTFYCIADEDTVRGFRLAGVEGTPVGSPSEAAEALEAAVRRAETGILIVTEEVADGIRDRVEAVRQGCDRPLIVEIPGPSGPSPRRRSLRQMVQAAVGILVRREEDA